VRLLLDTAPLYWWLIGHVRLPERVGMLIADAENDVLASAVSFYELHYKMRLGKLAGGIPDLDAVLRAAEIEILAISSRHAAHAGQLDWTHRDPWDRILAAQAMLVGCPLISTDAAFDAADVERIW
jgi:PIN domain nuclease of toxin-antitoxin system